ncbi:hypothetical protein BCR43DRAFT_486362 [Syncephalastrum racemosum]|uniref:Secreted protein n=1 Tax=Syncephalastrum racemosum TaxID=13706 RepID=A0A1X2HNV4_SYNRA|nr:hypothetical protein BCR43DRAFT_486362 [Syncephalastrum racemosum]
MFIVCFAIIAFAAFSVQALPLSSTDKAPSTSYTAIDEETTAFGVQVDRFAQLVSTHWQFDHLESIITNSYKHIAEQMQDHVQIRIHSTNTNIDDDEEPVHYDGQQQQYPIQMLPPSLDMMDLELLKAQIFNAIQSHTEGKLPNAWDSLGDKLSRPSLEAYIQHLVVRHCDKDESDHVSFMCLNDYAGQLMAELDRYVTRHLANVFDAMNNEYLPNLLEQTSDDLRRVLDYFNEAFLTRDELRLELNVVPWQQEQQEVRSQLFDLAALAGNNADHAPDFVAHYGRLARI